NLSCTTKAFVRFLTVSCCFILSTLMSYDEYSNKIKTITLKTLTLKNK
ncbi:MAG: hypothetical protein ACI9HU_001328, partial [Colwellia sp.]